jgi:hypothetical protein
MSAKLDFFSTLTLLDALRATSPTVELARAVASVLLVKLATLSSNKIHAFYATSLIVLHVALPTHVLLAKQGLLSLKIVKVWEPV